MGYPAQQVMEFICQCFQFVIQKDLEVFASEFVKVNLSHYRPRRALGVPGR
jgi:hypothetical protein